ncbi:MAG: transcription elongation factor GreA [Bdellovibrionales bacterium]|nr:transcription elongation factor GreA [Bdellovibrionales bacterium]
MNDKVPITLLGKLALEEELRRLKTIDRPLVIEQIARARENGDLSENADYAAAREKQSFIEGRILDIGDKLARAEVIDPKSIQSDKVLFGASVRVRDEDGKESAYQIVGEPEADLAKGRLSVTAPLARALMGKREGDEAIVKSPKGETTYEVVSIDYT